MNLYFADMLQGHEDGDHKLGLEVSHTMDDQTSSSDFRIAKNKSGPVFISNETETSFILTAYLKGYKKEHVDIDINEEGTHLGITVEKPVHEKVMSGWSMKMKQGETTRGFRKVFQIPDGVVLSRIKAKFNVQDSTLRIFMPKVVKGVTGIVVKEIKEEELIIETPHLPKEAAATDEAPETENLIMQKSSQANKGKEVEKETWTKEILVDDQQFQNHDAIETKEQKNEEKKEADRIENEREIAEQRIKEQTHQGVKDDIRSPTTAKASQEIEEAETNIEEMAEGRPEKKEVVDECESSEMRKGNDVGEKPSKEKKVGSEMSKMLSTPLIIAGSALLVSIVLLAINRIRHRKK